MAEKCKYSCKTLTATWLSPQKYRKRIGFEIQTREIRNPLKRSSHLCKCRAKVQQHRKQWHNICLGRGISAVVVTIAEKQLRVIYYHRPKRQLVCVFATSVIVHEKNHKINIPVFIIVLHSYPLVISHPELFKACPSPIPPFKYGNYPTPRKTFDDKSSTMEIKLTTGQLLKGKGISMLGTGHFQVVSSN